MNKAVEVNELKSDHVASNSNTTKNYKRNNNNNNKTKQYERRAQNTSQHTERNERNGNSRWNGRQNKNEYNRNDNRNSNYNQNNESKCKRCNYFHRFKDNCSAIGKTCRTCSKPNHFSSVCRSRNINLIEAAGNDEYYVGSVEKNTTSETDDAIGTRWIERVNIENQNVAFKIDTGAEMNVMPLNVFRRLNSNVRTQPANIKLRAFGGQRIVPKGMCSLLCKYKNASMRVAFAIVDLDVTPILGLATCTRMRIVNPPQTKNNVNKINRYNL